MGKRIFLFEIEREIHIVDFPPETVKVDGRRFFHLPLKEGQDLRGITKALKKLGILFFALRLNSQREDGELLFFVEESRLAFILALGGE